VSRTKRRGEWTEEEESRGEERRER